MGVNVALGGMLPLRVPWFSGSSKRNNRTEASSSGGKYKPKRSEPQEGLWVFFQIHSFIPYELYERYERWWFFTNPEKYVRQIGSYSPGIRVTNSLIPYEAILFVTPIPTRFRNFGVVYIGSRNLTESQNFHDVSYIIKFKRSAMVEKGINIEVKIDIWKNKPIQSSGIHGNTTICLQHSLDEFHIPRISKWKSRSNLPRFTSIHLWWRVGPCSHTLIRLICWNPATPEISMRLLWQNLRDIRYPSGGFINKKQLEKTHLEWPTPWEWPTLWEWSGQNKIFHQPRFPSRGFPFRFATFWGEVVWGRYNLTRMMSFPKLMLLRNGIWFFVLVPSTGKLLQAFWFVNLSHSEIFDDVLCWCLVQASFCKHFDLSTFLIQKYLTMFCVGAFYRQAFANILICQPVSFRNIWWCFVLVPFTGKLLQACLICQPFSFRNIWWCFVLVPSTGKLLQAFWFVNLSHSEIFDDVLCWCLLQASLCKHFDLSTFLIQKYSMMFCVGAFYRQAFAGILTC